MYVTRPLSQLLKSPESLAAPPDGPNSGYLVIQDEEARKNKGQYLNTLPFPQNKELSVEFLPYEPVFLIPVLNQPLSSNRYYAIVPYGTHEGEAFTCSTEDNRVSRCCCSFIEQVAPRPLDPQNIYQQFEIIPSHGRNGCRFFAKSIAPDGVPPLFLQADRWKIYAKTPSPNHFKLDTAHGLDSKLRARLPEFDCPPSWKSSKPCVVGKWYSPFIFVEEGTLQDQMRRSMHYEVTLEQRWEKIFRCQKNDCENQGNSVVIDVLLEKEEVFINGESKAVWNEKNVANGLIWYMSHGRRGERRDVGLRVELVERMKWEQKRGGWIGGEERQVKINKVEEFKEAGEWSEFGCYVLVERFSLKRVDGSSVLSYDFKHFQHIKTKWECTKYSLI